MSEPSLYPADVDAAALPISQPRFEHFRVGEIDCYALSDGAIIRTIPTRQATGSDPTRSASGGSRQIYMNPLSCLLVRLPGTGLVLIDAGFGRDPTVGGMFMPSVGRLQLSMAQAGFTPEDIDAVVISHMHPDHIGGLYNDDGTRVYPNATYNVSAEELAYWSRDPLDLSQAASPPPVKIEMTKVIKRFHKLAGDELKTFPAGEEALPGLGTMLLTGHAPGQVGFTVSNGGERLVFVADALSHPVVSIQTPDTYNPMDMDSDRAVKTRHELIAMLSDSDWQLFASHFPFPARGHIQGKSGEATWTPTAAG